jgi:hypothetical protein
VIEIGTTTVMAAKGTETEATETAAISTKLHS